MYKPLPKELRLGFSDIHDIGVFAKEFIPQGTNLGMSHMKMKDTIFRTPLGGFINHADEPNCTKVELLMREDSLDYKKWNLMTTQNIKKGEEITLRYTFYNISIPMTEKEEYRNAGITKEEAETSSKEWIKGYKKWKKTNGPHD